MQPIILYDTVTIEYPTWSIFGYRFGPKSFLTIKVSLLKDLTYTVEIIIGKRKNIDFGYIRKKCNDSYERLLNLNSKIEFKASKVTKKHIRIQSSDLLND